MVTNDQENRIYGLAVGGGKSYINAKEAWDAVYTDEMVDNAYSLAYLAHHGKEYGEHGSYFSAHVEKVVFNTYKYCLNNWFMKHVRNAFVICAYLHDVVEDSNVTLEQIEKEFGIEIREAIDALTRRGGESRNQNIIRLKENDMAHIVKKFDNLSNYTQCLYDGDEKRAKMYAEVATLLNS